MKTNAKAMVLASFIADTLSLGVHWIYDVEQIRRIHNRVDGPIAPTADSYHHGKNQGDFTHYGDQALALLRSLAAGGGFSLDLFCRSWRELFQEYAGYIDHATKETLANLERGVPPTRCGSHSTDLGGPARIAPLVCWYHNDLDMLRATARQQTAMTHNSPAALAGADFLARTAFTVLQGASPANALEEALEEGIADIDLDGRVRMAMDSAEGNSTEVIARMGQMCGIAAALPGALHLTLAYSDNLREALIANAMAGGDSAARGMVVGMLLGAHLGEEAIPRKWLEVMTAGPAIQQLLAAIA